MDKAFSALDKTELAACAAIAAGFTALLSLFNIGGRFVWASLSDKLGRKLTFSLFFVFWAASCILAYPAVLWRLIVPCLSRLSV